MTKEKTLAEWSARQKGLIIYIDESYQEEDEVQDHSPYAVIAGLIWGDDDPQIIQKKKTTLHNPRINPKNLPIILDHSRDEGKNKNHIEKLRKSGRAKPFIFVFDLKFRNEYIRLIQTSLKLLLGYLLTPHSDGTTVRIQLDRMDAHQCPHGLSVGAHYHHILDTMWYAKGYQIKEMCWYNTDWVPGYFGYADLLAKLPLLSRAHMKAARSLSGYQNYEGYLEVLDPANIEALDALYIPGVGLNVDGFTCWAQRNINNKLLEVIARRLRTEMGESQ